MLFVGRFLLVLLFGLLLLVSQEELEDSLKESESESESEKESEEEEEGEPFFFLLLRRFLLDAIAHLVLVNKAVLGELSDDPIFSLLLLLFLLPFRFPSYNLFDVGGKFLG